MGRRMWRPGARAGRWTVGARHRVEAAACACLIASGRLAANLRVDHVCRNGSCLSLALHAMPSACPINQGFY